MARVTTAEPARRDEAASTLHVVATAITVAVAAALPLPYGSVDDFWVAVWCLPLAVALVLFDLRRVTVVHAVMLAIAMALVGATVLAAIVQGVPTAALRAAPVWAEAERLLGQPLRQTVSVDPAKTHAALGRPILLGLAFACAFLAATERDAAAILMSGVRWIVTAIALYGLAAHLLDPDSLLGIEKFAYREDLTATFVNRNTAATFIGSGLILWTARLMEQLDRRVPRSAAGPRDWGSALLNAPPRSLIAALVCTFVCLAALLMTRSRAGVLLSVGGAVSVAALCLRHRAPGRLAALSGLSALVLVGAVLLELLGGAVAGRIGGQGLIDEGRLAGYATTLDMIRAAPWFGSGLGTFVDMFPAHRLSGMSTSGIWDRAHDIPLEIAAELGIPFATLVVGVFVAALVKLLHGGLTRRRDADIPIAAFGVGMLGCLHALVDFSAQIPGFGAVWMVILGCGLAQSVRRPAPVVQTTSRWAGTGLEMSRRMPTASA